MKSKIYLILEFITLFILLPTAIHRFHLHKFFILILWAFAAIDYIYLKKAKGFDNKNLARREAVNTKNIKRILVFFIIATIPITLATYILLPDKFLSFILRAPALWALVMVLYPVLSVYPQEIIYRAFFFHRYKNIFKKENILLLASSLSFGYAHVIFNNYVAIIMCAIGGLLFGANYMKNKSLLLVSLEHALYGCMIFTVGLGWYFYRGSVVIN